MSMGFFAQQGMGGSGGGGGGDAALLSVTETIFASNVTSHPVDMPAVVNAGDTLLIGVTFRANSGDLRSAVIAPSGWTIENVFSSGFSVFNTVFALLRRTASGSEGGTTVDVETTVACHAAAQVFRVENASNFQLKTSSQAGTSQIILDDMSVANAGAQTVWIGGFGSNGTAAPQSWPPTLTDFQTTTASGGSNVCRVISASRTDTSGAMGTSQTFTMGTNSASARFTIALW